MDSAGEVNNSDLVIKYLFEEMLSRGKHVRFQTRGWSMYPCIRDGDFVTVRPLGVEEMKVGDVIAYQNVRNKKIAVHRLIRKKSRRHVLSGLDFAGDNALSHDPPVDPLHHLFGKVVTVERNGRTMSLESGTRYISGYVKALVRWFCPWAPVHWRRCVQAFGTFWGRTQEAGPWLSSSHHVDG